MVGKMINFDDFTKIVQNIVQIGQKFLTFQLEY